MNYHAGPPFQANEGAHIPLPAPDHKPNPPLPTTPEGLEAAFGTSHSRLLREMACGFAQALRQRDAWRAVAYADNHTMKGSPKADVLEAMFARRIAFLSGPQQAEEMRKMRTGSGVAQEVCGDTTGGTDANKA